MAEAAKVIRIELRVGGGSSSGSGERKKKEKKIPKSKTIKGRLELTMNKLAGAGAITIASHMISEGFSIAETLSYNSDEKTNMMILDISKKAVSTTLVTGGYILGGPVGAAIGMSINQLVVQPLGRMGEISIQRHLDHTRATNRFYLTDFAGKGNYTFDYSSGSFVNENLQKTANTILYKRSFR
jgi:hypothetical protein